MLKFTVHPRYLNQGKTNERKMHAKTLIKASFTVLLIGVILYNVPTERLVTSFKNIDIRLFLGAFILFPIVILVGSEKWRQIIRHEAKELRYREALISFLGGMSLGLLTPGRVGEFGRIIFIRKTNLSTLVGISLIDKVVDLEVTLFLGICGIFFILGFAPFITILISVILGAIFIFYPQVFSAPLKKAIPVLPFRDKIQNIIDGTYNIPIATLILCIFYRFIASIIDLCQFYLLLNAFATIGIVEVFLVYPIVILTNILPLTIGGIGVREGVSVLLLSHFGIPPEAAVNASFLLFCLNTLIPGLMGALFLPQVRIGFTKDKSRVLKNE